MSAQEKLALLGGRALFPEGLRGVAWPPIAEATGEKLKALYMSGQWSFDCPAEQAFAKDYAAYHTAKHGIFMVNGTVTLHSALLALGVGKGDEVILPALTWPATAMAVHYVGATPVFVDIEPDTLCIDPEAVEAAITPRTKAIIPVHLYGSMADMDAIMAIANKRGLKVIEDCAHMQGGVWDGKGAGSIGHIGSFSFQQSKTVSSGEGGICLTNDDALAERLFRVKHIGYAQGTSQGAARTGPPAGLMCHNFRATGFQAVILHDQLANLKQLIATYDANLEYLRERVDAIPGLRVQARGRKASPQGAYGVVFLVEPGGPLSGIARTSFSQALVAEGLNHGGTYGPVYKHLLYNMDPSTYRIANGSCEVAEGLGTLNAYSLAHQWLGAPRQTLDGVVSVLRKVAAGADQLQAHVPAAV